MNTTTVPTTERDIEPCAHYDWCSGHYAPQAPVSDTEAPFHYDTDEREFAFSVGEGDRLGSRPTIRFVHEADHNGHALYVQYDDATIDVPRDEVPKYLEELRRLVDELETYYRMNIALRAVNS